MKSDRSPRRAIPGGIVLILLVILQGLFSCESSGKKNRVVYVNSYHQGFPPSDDITSGVLEVLASEEIEITSYFMDTKRYPGEEYIRDKARALVDSIRLIQPDVLIVSDDNALKYLVLPHFRGDPLAIVFCGVNWSADQYDLSGINITGILEQLPVRELVETIKPYYPTMQNLLVLNENTTTSRKTRPILDTLMSGLGITVHQELVDDFDSWKLVFADANSTYDIIYLQTRGAIQDWDHEEALEHIERHIRIPLVTCEEFMMPYAVFGLTQLSREQGSEAARKAKMILEGTRPSEIPVTRNHLSKKWINTRLAEKIGFQPQLDLLEQASLVE
jgi:ABC-type uncharacterized transport system substrate-binding protein